MPLLSSYFKNVLLTLLTGVLLYASWPMSPFTFLIFIAWVPLLIVEGKSTRPFRFFFILLLNMLIWNAATTWWIWNASEGGAIGAIITNSILMTIPWMFFRITKQKLGADIGYLSLILYWITFEYIHHNWDLSWPWLTLGNAFATHPHWVKWYQFTGTSGGTLWVWVINIVFFKYINKKYYNFSGNSNSKKYLVVAIILIIAPVLYSYIGFSKLLHEYGKQLNVFNVVVVQPNIDPYKEKFSVDPALQIDKLIRLSETQIDSQTRLVVWPETAVPAGVWEEQIKTDRYFQPIYDFIKKHAQILLVTGIDSYKNFGHKNSGDFAIRYNEASNIYYEAYNTAMAVDTSMNIQLYHKAKLVPGVEGLPSWLAFMGKMFEDYGGINGTLGRSTEPMVFSSNISPYKPAPVICYESIYGEYVSRYIKNKYISNGENNEHESYMQKGANIIAVMTNDGWWGNTPGYKQHMSYARLRAIETRKWIARSANTGISCFIDPDGNIINPQPWNKEAAIKLSIPAIHNETFFVQHGDWISRMAWILSLVLIIWTAFESIRKRIMRKFRLKVE